MQILENCLFQQMWSTSSYFKQVAFPTLYHRDLMQKMESCKRLWQYNYDDQLYKPLFMFLFSFFFFLKTTVLLSWKYLFLTKKFMKWNIILLRYLQETSSILADSNLLFRYNSWKISECTAIFLIYDRSYLYTNLICISSGRLFTIMYKTPTS